MVLKKIKKLAISALNKIEEVTSEQPSKPQKIESPVSDTTKSQVRFIQVSIQDVIKITLVLMALALGATLLVSIRDIAFILLLSYLFAAALVPSVERLKQYKIPAGVSVIFIYILIISILSIMVGNLVPILSYELVDLAFQAQNLINNLSTQGLQLPGYLSFFQPIVDNTLTNITTTEISNTLQKNLLTVGGNLSTLAGNAIDFIVVLSNGLANAVLIMVLSYFITVDQKNIDKFIISLFPRKYQSYIDNRSKRIKSKVGNWLRGQILLMLAIAVLTYIGLIALNFKYAFTLALFAGFTELIPVIGPIIAWIATIPVAINISTSALIAVTVLYIIIQRLENNLLVPVIMRKVTGLHPIIVITAMMLGYKFQGILGIVISIPLAGIVGMFLHDYLVKTHHIEDDSEG